MKSPTAHTRVAVVIGDPVEHSSSPAMHNAAFEAGDVDAVFVALKVARDDLEKAVTGLRASGVFGASVTVPHKRAVVELCDRLEEPAARIGAVNCLVFEPDGTVVGHNTDAGGFVDGIAEVLGFNPAGKSMVVLGGGGAARAVAAGLDMAGADEIAVVARNPGKIDWTEAKEWSAESLAHLAGSADLLVDCTSRALSDDEAQSPAAFPVSALHEGAAVVSLVYHRKPELLVRAEERGLMVADGAGMLVHQGARAFRLWTGQDAATDVMWQALRPDPNDRQAE